MRDLPLGKDFVADTGIDVVKQVLYSIFYMEPCTYAFNPKRGIDWDKYLFEYNDEQLNFIYKQALAKEIADLDVRIQNVGIDVVQEDNEARLNITIVCKDGTYDTITKKV